MDGRSEREIRLYILDYVNGRTFSGCDSRKQNNNRGLIKAVKNITEDHNLYIIAYDQSFDNDQVIRETKKIIEYSSQKRNVILLNMICFEYILLEFEKLPDWVFAEEDDFRLQRADLLEARKALLNAVRQSADYKRNPMIVTLFDKTKEYNIEQFVAKLLYLLTRNTGFEVSKSKLGVCWQKNCCEFAGRQSDDLCGLDLKRLDLKEKMQEVMEYTRLKQQLNFFTGGSTGMITIYKNKRDIPQNSKIVDMNDVYFNQHTSRVIDERADHIIKIIDGVRICDKYKIVSKFQNEILNIDKLSTGCKTALNILYFPEITFSIKECGDNALDCIYGLEKGNVFSEYPVISFEMEKVHVVDGTGKYEIASYDDLKVWWEDV